MTTQPALIVIRPGDNVLVTLTDDVDADTSAEILRQLRRSFPKTDFTLLSGVSGIAIT